MMKKLLIFICFIIKFKSSYCQTKHNPCLIQPGYAAKMMPLSLIDSWGLPSLRIANEFRLFQGLSYEIDYGYYFPDYQPYHQNIKGLYLSNQLRHYFFLYSGFIAFQVIYKSQNFTLKDSVTVETGVSTNPYYKIPSSIQIERKAFALNVVVGKQTFFDRFIVEIYGGLGIRIRNVQHLTENTLSGTYDYTQFKTTQQLYGPSKNEIQPNIVLGFKFGYWILK